MIFPNDPNVFVVPGKVIACTSRLMQAHHGIGNFDTAAPFCEPLVRFFKSSWLGFRLIASTGFLSA